MERVGGTFVQYWILDGSNHDIYRIASTNPWKNWDSEMRHDDLRLLEESPLFTIKTPEGGVPKDNWRRRALARLRSPGTISFVLLA